MEEDCVFCKIVKNENPRPLEYEDDKVVVFNSISPQADHHLLIVPKKHVATFKDLDENANELLLKMISVAQKMIDDKNLSVGYRLQINGGRYQEIQHLHLHLLGGKLKGEDHT